MDYRVLFIFFSKLKLFQPTSLRTDYHTVKFNSFKCIKIQYILTNVCVPSRAWPPPESTGKEGSPTHPHQTSMGVRRKGRPVLLYLCHSQEAKKVCRRVPNLCSAGKIHPSWPWLHHEEQSTEPRIHWRLVEWPPETQPQLHQVGRQQGKNTLDNTKSNRAQPNNSGLTNACACPWLPFYLLSEYIENILHLYMQYLNIAHE